MQNINGPHNTSGAFPTALQLVTALTENDYQQLYAFADIRMRQVKRTPGSERLMGLNTPADFVHSAIAQALLGDAEPGQGRRLSDRQRASQPAFLAGLGSIINSELSNLLTSAEAGCEHLEFPDEVPAGGAGNPRSRLERADLKRALFARLRPLVEHDAELTAIADAWEPDFLEDDRINRSGFDRRKVHQVRRLARGILAELAHDADPGTPDGMELLF